jgi:hypothetical protein
MNNILEHLPKLDGKLEHQVDPYQEEASLDGGSSNRTPFVDNYTWCHFLKVYMNIFNGTNPMGWVTQMEHYLFLHGITYDMMKLQVGVL